MGQCVRSEGLTRQHVQTHIDHVCIHTMEEKCITDIVEVKFGRGRSFVVHVLEDCAKIIDFGPRYD